MDVPLRALIPRIGRAKAIRSYEISAEAVTKLARLVGKFKIDCDYEHRHSLFLARKPEEVPELREEFELRRNMGIELDFWDEREIHRHFCFSRPAALFSRLGGQLDPHKLTHGLLAAACRRGLQVYDRSPVVRFDPNRRGICLRTSEGFA